MEKRGRPPKVDGSALFSARVSAGTADKLKAFALECGYIYNSDGAPGAFLDAIAQAVEHPQSRETLLAVLKNRDKV